MHDPTSLFRFEEHDVYIPMATLEELDNNKKGMSEVVAQRAPGEPLPRRDGHARRSRHRGGHPARSARRQERDRAAVPADRGDQRRAAGAARQRQGGQPDHRRRHAPAGGASAAPGDPGVQRHQHAHQGACARARRRGLLQRQGARGHRPPLHRHARAAGRLLGQARQGHGVVAAGRAHLLPRARAAVLAPARQRVRLPRGGPAVLRAGEGSERQDRGPADAQGLHAPAPQRLGHHRAQPRAELRAERS